MQRPYPPGRAPTIYQTPQQRRVSLRQYVIMPSLFFLAMLATWIAPTINRISEFVHRKHGTHSLLLAVSTLGSLRGFWNGVIFITIGMKGWKRRASERRMALRQVRWSFSMLQSPRWSICWLHCNYRLEMVAGDVNPILRSTYSKWYPRYLIK